MEILDMKCAECGSKIGATLEEALITKSLGVLQEDGVYAFFLYLKTKKGPGEKIKESAFDFLELEKTASLEVVREKFKDNLDALLFAKELLERTLVYARYHAKAIGGE
ncbi:hypothetical protein C4544_03260 [candidate division WS5 bacterium]|uniref:Uncharacterized protein n=1 Tax=candidate division WS5 bacterium TaxID=2093353 RepID=A0A419DDS1_9BACT|nr:MAG: hypothetical protein C4544_03260 [candidate division WS5 bacterium]